MVRPFLLEEVMLSSWLVCAFVRRLDSRLGTGQTSGCDQPVARCLFAHGVRCS